MAWCPHCHHFYDEDNETQPCCGACGHPHVCGCDDGRHTDAPSWNDDTPWLGDSDPGSFVDDDFPF